MMAALGQGLRLVKFFPASHLGGPAGLAAFTGVFPELSFVPTGGVGPNNLGDYLSMTSVAAVGGSWMIPREALRHGDGPTIEALTKQAVEFAAPYKLSTREDT
jgi:2-dehydro-3-deoxyphosphogluconate aldolase/(4S)-4-hydroxy-2-oxoglutarate aldolase